MNERSKQILHMIASLILLCIAIYLFIQYMDWYAHSCPAYLWDFNTTCSNGVCYNITNITC